MTSIDRRSVLRAAAGTAAGGALAAGCGDGHTVRAAAHPTSPTDPTASPASRTPAGSRTGPGALPALPPDLPDQIAHGPSGHPMVALTFHGQGDPKEAEALLSEAERAGAGLTVLAVGSWLEAYPAMARRVLDGGHELGNHTENHRDINAMPASQAAAEIGQCADRLRRLTGGVGRWFRPSQAQYASPSVLRLAHRAGYPHVLSYDLDSLDYTDPGADAVRETVLGHVHGGSVVSLHFGHPGTVTAMPAILDGLRQRGLRAVTVSHLLAGKGD
ncbi:polysaccharide deacetylase family protein [Streptomyces sp. PTM05]|uniref:Polysaccharide deacetylase family protein n=1 Tax=Streptantibioticus parmotrematis TaxID=2873249 RepID=A0ABS7QMQ4_9ACTN|nr:polysaccharide deacetylase family protein [Streptantibioticus parmotrematis]MBY8884471.1 polysaccharide deacetylase family protein [Streptantibioticus parmotrematis]